MGNSSEDNNRKLAESRLNMGKDPGGAYADLSAKYQKQQAQGGGGKPSCFTAETEVLTPTGWRTIATIKKHDTVLSLALADSALVPRAVLEVKAHPEPVRIWELRFSGSDLVVRTTESHSFLTQRGWIRTRNLIAGDATHLIQAGGGISKQQLRAIRATTAYEPTFNLITYADNNFIVRTGVVHNFTYFRALRSLLANAMHDLDRLMTSRHRRVVNYS